MLSKKVGHGWKKLDMNTRKEMYMNKAVIVDRRMKLSIKENLSKMGYRVIDSYDHKNLYDAIRSHVDIGIFKSGDKLIASKESYHYYKNVLGDYLTGDGLDTRRNKLDTKMDTKIKYDLLCGSSGLCSEYPGDVAYNISDSSVYVLGKIQYIDPVVLEVLKKSGRKFLDINQGYAACSICWIDERSLITSDSGIASAVINSGLDVDLLKIRPGHIELFGMDYGFIGGASCRLDDASIGIFGDIASHPDAADIVEFIESKGKKIVSLGEGNIQDYGGLIVL